MSSIRAHISSISSAIGAYSGAYHAHLMRLIAHIMRHISARISAAWCLTFCQWRKNLIDNATSKRFRHSYRSRLAADSSMLAAIASNYAAFDALIAA